MAFIITSRNTHSSFDIVESCLHLFILDMKLLADTFSERYY